MSLYFVTTYIPKPGDWRLIGEINNKTTWLALKPESEFLAFGCDDLHEMCRDSLVVYYFALGTRVTFTTTDKGQHIHYKPQDGLLKRTSAQ